MDDSTYYYCASEALLEPCWVRLKWPVSALAMSVRDLLDRCCMSQVAGVGR